MNHADCRPPNACNSHSVFLTFIAHSKIAPGGLYINFTIEYVWGEFQILDLNFGAKMKISIKTLKACCLSLTLGSAATKSLECNASGDSESGPGAPSFFSIYTQALGEEVGVREPRSFVNLSGVQLAYSDPNMDSNLPVIICLHAIGHGGRDFEAFKSAFENKSESSL
jgi:hypothetical protein